jgi:hypothetical protein
MDNICVLDRIVCFYKINNEDYVSLTDIAKYKDPKRADYIISNWLRNRNTIEFIGVWEIINNKNFNSIEFDGFRRKAGLNSFVLSSKNWIKKTNSIGLISKSGRYGGTFAHRDIAFEFASWISVEFKLYLIKEFQRLKLEESKNNNLEWNIKKQLSKINYIIHTDAIKNNLIPYKVTSNQKSNVYASEADVLNIALFGCTAKEWSLSNKKKKGNIRDYANVSQLVCLSNLENINALLINENISQSDRLVKLNEIAIYQMKLLTQNKSLYIKKKFLLEDWHK